MNKKKLLSVLVVLSLLLSMLPTAVLAQSATIPIEGPRVESVLVKASADTPVLSSGNHPSYLDRVASLPDYALEYYRWLEDNSGPDGVLVDPTKATEYNGEFYHSVHYASGSEKFTFSSREEMLATGGEIAAAALDREFASFSNWAGVVQDIFDREHPEVFWLNGRSSISYMGSWTYSTRGNVCTVIYEADLVVWLNYPGFDIRNTKYLDPKTVVEAMNTRDAAAQEILAGCPDGSDYDRVAYLNDALTARNAYNSAVASGKSSKAESDSWECISALVGNSGNAGPVCEGYARAFQVLCNALQIPCILVDGEAISGLNDQPEDHMWNYVQIDGGWYAVDVTWNDPYVSSNPEEKRSGNENRKWLLLGSDSEVATGLSFLDSHVVENQIRPNGLAFTNGPVLERSAYDPNAVSTYSISGKVTSASTDPVTVQLWQESTLLGTQTLNGSSATYTFDGIVPGSYQLKVSKAGHVPRTYSLLLTEGENVTDLKIHRPGDINGDGRVNVGDTAKVYSHVKKTALLTGEYELACADVSGDGRLNVGDTAKIYAHAKRTALLW